VHKKLPVVSGKETVKALAKLGFDVRLGKGDIHNSIKRLEASGKIKTVKYREKVF